LTTVLFSRGLHYRTRMRIGLLSVSLLLSIVLASMSGDLFVDEVTMNGYVETFKRQLDTHIESVLAVDDIQELLEPYEDELLHVKWNGSEKFETLYQKVSIKYNDLVQGAKRLKHFIENDLKFYSHTTLSIRNLIPPTNLNTPFLPASSPTKSPHDSSPPNAFKTPSDLTPPLASPSRQPRPPTISGPPRPPIVHGQSIPTIPISKPSTISGSTLQYTGPPPLPDGRTLSACCDTDVSDVMFDRRLRENVTFRACEENSTFSSLTQTKIDALENTFGVKYTV